MPTSLLAHGIYCSDQLFVRPQPCHQMLIYLQLPMAQTSRNYLGEHIHQSSNISISDTMATLKLKPYENDPKDYKEWSLSADIYLL